MKKFIERAKTFFASPEGSAAVTGLLRPIFVILIGFGVAITAEQVDQAIATAGTLIILVNAVLSLVSVKSVTQRADSEELDAAQTGLVLTTNNAE